MVHESVFEQNDWAFDIVVVLIWRNSIDIGMIP